MFLMSVLLLLAGPLAATPAADLEPFEPQLQDGVFATFGIGIVDVEAGSGVDVPFGLTLFSGRWRTMLTLTALDVGLLQRKDQDSRYLRVFDARRGGQFCIDTNTGQFASFSRCSGSTDVLRSTTLDLNFLPVRELYVADRLGAVHVGLGARVREPRTLYGTLGMFFPAQTGRAVGVQLSMGREYIFFGMKWGIDLRRVAGFF